MLRFTKSRLAISYTATVLAVAALLGLGCGGSTRGTGGVTIEGRILSASQQAVPNVLVTLLQTGEQDISTANGDFVIVSQVTGDIDLLFEKDALTAQASISSLPQGASVMATFELDESSNSVSIEEIEIDDSSDPAGDDDDSSSSGSDSDDDSDDDEEDDEDEDENKEDSDDDDNSGSGSSESDDSDSDDNDNDDDIDDDEDQGQSSDSDDSSDSSEIEDDSDCNEQDVQGAITALSNSSLTVSGSFSHLILKR